MATTHRKNFGGEAAGATGPRSERSAAPLRCDESSKAALGLAVRWRTVQLGFQLRFVDLDDQIIEGAVRVACVSVVVARDGRLFFVDVCHASKLVIA